MQRIFKSIINFKQKKKMAHDAFGWGYPAGAEHDPNAPYNQYEPDEVDVDCTYSVVLSKLTTVSTNDYTKDEFDDLDFDGVEYYHVGGVEYDFSDTDFVKEFDKQHLSPIELISELEEIVTKLINGEEIGIRKERLKFILEECKDWECDEIVCEKA